MITTLHPTIGVNAHMGQCRRCGGDNGELILIGNRIGICKCDGCGIRIYGHRPSERCPSCNDAGPHSVIGTIKEGDRIPGATCDKCRKSDAEHRAIVESGGVYFKCAACNATGVIKPSKFATAVRKAHGMEAPALCGVEFQKCEEHTTA